MRKIYFLLLITGVLFSSCNKKGTKSKWEQDNARVVPEQTSESPVFVTDRDKPASPKKEQWGKPFPEKETEHVRIVNYNPFGKSDELVICLDDLCQSFCYPHPGNKTSDYGMRGRAMHTGVDIQAALNDTIRAAFNGQVRMSKFYSGYGNIVVIRHPSGLETVYAHNTKNLVRTNQLVSAGDPIALAGSTGRASGVHVHFEVRVMGEHFDPNLVMDTWNRCIREGNVYLKQRDGRILASGAGFQSPVQTPSIPVKTKDPEPVMLADNTIIEPVVEKSEETNQKPAAAIYKVQKGDTLYSISRKYGLTVDELRGLNGMASDDVLKAGQDLIVSK